MKRDSIFYQLFARSPTLLFDLIPDPPDNAENYRFDSVAVKEPKFEIDGVFLPPEGSVGVVFFSEVQFQKDEQLCERAFAESFLYFYRNRDQFSDWRMVFIYPSRTTEQGNSYPYRALLESDQVYRIYIDELDDFWQLPLWVGLMVLTTVSQEQEAFEKARYLVSQSQRQKSQSESHAIIEMVAAIVSYQFTQLSHQEILAMLDINMKETRFYRETVEEARREEVIKLLGRLLTKRFGNLPDSVRSSITELPFQKLEDLVEAQLDFESLGELRIWLNREHT